MTDKTQALDALEDALDALDAAREAYDTLSSADPDAAFAAALVTMRAAERAVLAAEMDAFPE